jgi:hypothetical protein
LLLLLLLLLPNGFVAAAVAVAVALGFVAAIYAIVKLRRGGVRRLYSVAENAA